MHVLLQLVRALKRFIPQSRFTRPFLGATQIEQVYKDNGVGIKKLHIRVYIYDAKLTRQNGDSSYQKKIDRGLKVKKP